MPRNPPPRYRARPRIDVILEARTHSQCDPPLNLMTRHHSFGLRFSRGSNLTSRIRRSAHSRWSVLGRQRASATSRLAAGKQGVPPGAGCSERFRIFSGRLGLPIRPKKKTSRRLRSSAASLSCAGKPPPPLVRKGARCLDHRRLKREGITNGK